eukprot:9323944-Pyramimonas_sp.AAC.1
MGFGFVSAAGPCKTMHGAVLLGSASESRGARPLRSRRRAGVALGLGAAWASGVGSACGMVFLTFSVATQ